jgi:hypothetical protein
MGKGKDITRIERDRMLRGDCRHCGGPVPCWSQFGDVRVGVRKPKPARLKRGSLRSVK